MPGSRPSSRPPTPPPKDTQYSTLEVDYNYWLENKGESAPIVGQDPRDEKVIGHNDEKIVSYCDGKIISYNDIGKQAVAIDTFDVHSDSPQSLEERKDFSQKRKTSFILLTVVIILMIAGTLAGGVGRTIAARHREPTATAPRNTSSPTTRVAYANTGLAAMQWTDLNGTLHKRVYYQDSSSKIQESAWDNSTGFNTAWKINAISDAVKPGTPIAAAAGYPHASHNYSLVCLIYLPSSAAG